jgi:predicted RNase H-like HicB family nuclease
MTPHRLAFEAQEGADGRWVAKAPGLAGAEAEGSTREEALARVRELSLKLLANRLETSEQRSHARLLAKSRFYALLWFAMHIVLSLAIDGLWLGGGLAPAIAFLLVQLPPLGLVVFCERLGAFRGPMPRFHYVDTPTPALAIAALGWVMLIGIAALHLWGWLR